MISSQVFQEPLILWALLEVSWKVMANWRLCVVAALKLLTLDMDPETSKGSSSTYSLQGCLTPYCKSTARSMEVSQPRLSPEFLGLSEPVLKSQIPAVVRLPQAPISQKLDITLQNMAWAFWELLPLLGFLVHSREGGLREENNLAWENVQRAVAWVSQLHCCLLKMRSSPQLDKWRTSLLPEKFITGFSLLDDKCQRPAELFKPLDFTVGLWLIQWQLMGNSVSSGSR